MKNQSHHNTTPILIILLLLGFTGLFQISCILTDRIIKNKDKDSTAYIVSLDTTLYSSLDEDSSDELVEAGTKVIITGKCQDRKITDGEVYCPIKMFNTQKEGWVLEYTLVKFEDYLPGEGQ